MASSRESPPVEATPSSPAQLTPRSKVNALLARFDDSSDDGVKTVGTARERLAALRKKDDSKREDTIPAVQKAQDTKSPGKSNNISTDEDDEDAVKPARRRARAQLEVGSDDCDQHSLSTGSPAQRTKGSPKISHISPSKPSPPLVREGSDDNVPVKPRKRKLKAAPAATPSPSPRKEGSTSPGLFVSPRARKSTTPPGNGSDSDDLPANLTTSERVLAKVTKIREERKAKQAQARQEGAEEAARLRKQGEEDGSDGSEDDGGRRLTQQAQPTRKASKKAMEEMARESQRLARTHQLTYKPTTKKKFTKASFFDKFNFHPDGESTPQATSSSPAPHSDIEMQETPPTSPATHEENSKPQVTRDIEMTSALQDDDEILPSLEDVIPQAGLSPTGSKPDKGKGKALEQSIPADAKAPKISKQRPVRVRPPKIVPMTNDSDDDLEIVSIKQPAQQARLDQFLKKMPEKKTQESHSLNVLRILAHVTSPGKQIKGKNKKPSVDSSSLQMSLQQRARQQAASERQERIQKLKDSGVIIQSTEEREKAMAEVEGIMARARRKGEEISKREKAAAKKAREANGEIDPLGDSSDDEDWVEKRKPIADEVALSGAEDSDEGSDEDGSDADGEEEEDVDEDDDANGSEDVENVASNPMFDEEASESEEEDVQQEQALDEEIGDVEMDIDEENDDPLPVQQRIRARRSNVIMDEDDEQEQVNNTPVSLRTDSPITSHTKSPAAPNSVLRSASKTFIPGVTVAGPAGLGLTQIFAGTMDDSQTDELDGSPTAADMVTPQPASKEDPLAFLRMRPPPTLPTFMPTMEDTQDMKIQDSQPEAMDTQVSIEETPISLNFSQSQLHGFDSLNQGAFPTQYSDFGTPTQDTGFDKMTPIQNRFAEPPPSTVDTVLLDGPKAVPETPTMQPKRKLRQKMQVAALSDDENDGAEEDIEAQSSFSKSKDAFAVMRKASKKPEIEDFDKTKSFAKEMVNEQAEESDDEYAGLGGASDDESGDEDAFVKEMIDDDHRNDIDESKLAAFFADRERANDEKQVEKLYRDISKGMLRRKKGANYDLSDSDDDGEARRRMKQREFAKMRKALLADERIGKIAENPKRQAFLRSIEDRGSDDDMDFLDDPVEQVGTESQTQDPSQNEEFQQRIPDSQPEVMGPPTKRKFTEDPTTSTQPRLPPNLRRTKPDKRPSSLSEIRESLSSLIEEPNSLLSHNSAGFESDEEDELSAPHQFPQLEEEAALDSNKENRNSFQSRRTSVPVIDRISLKRNASSGLASSTTRLAFATDSSAPGFKVPPLLRRATTNNSLASSSSSGNGNGLSATERMAGGADKGVGGVRKGAGRNSGVNYFKREEERRKMVGERERRREEKMVKGAKGRRKVMGGLFGGGKFE